MDRDGMEWPDRRRGLTGGLAWFGRASLAIMLATFTPAGAQAAGRVALVVGNSAYETSPLRNPVNDAEAVGAALARMGFDVTVLRNADEDAMDDALGEFEKTSAGADVALLFYAGHGMEMNGANYLIPVDARLESASAVRRETIPLDSVLASMANARTRIAILDACRNNPFARSMRGAARANVRSGGLAAVASGEGLLVAYAAAQGEVADDGDAGGNSPYTTALLEHLERPGVDVRIMLGDVGAAVMADTGDQQPFIYASLSGEHHLTPAGPTVVRVDPPRRRAGDVFRDCDGCPEMVVIPAGEFRMGSPASEEYYRDNEGPQHRVTLRSFALGVTEVTFDEWEACVRGGGCGGYRPDEYRLDDEGLSRGARPVNNVDWEDARAYVRWLSRETGESYRLPSESEWEYAARAGTETPFHTGATISTDQANYHGDYTYGSGRRGTFRGRTTPVGTFAPNAFGLHDVHGNVREWTADCWHDGYRGAPADGSPSFGGDCGRRVFRGGSWFDAPWSLRSAARNWYTTELRDDLVGFRVARTLD